MSSHGLPNERDYWRYSSVDQCFLWAHAFLRASEYLHVGDTICNTCVLFVYPTLSLSQCISACLFPILSCPPPFLALFYLPIVDKSKAHIAREQLVTAISNHHCTSQSPSFLQPIFLCARHSINPHCFGRCPGTLTLKAPQSLFYILSLFCIS